MRTPLLLSALLLAGCPGDVVNPNLPSCDLPNPEEHPADTFRGTIGGESWEAPAVPPGSTWQLAGTGFFTASGDGSRDMTIRLTNSSVFLEEEDGSVSAELDEDIESVFGARIGADFALGNQNDDGGDISLTIDSVTHHTNQPGGGGFLRLGFQDGEDGAPGLILACFFYTAGEAQGDALVEVEGGAFVLSE